MRIRTKDNSVVSWITIYLNKNYLTYCLHTLQSNVCNNITEKVTIMRECEMGCES